MCRRRPFEPLRPRSELVAVVVEEGVLGRDAALALVEFRDAARGVAPGLEEGDLVVVVEVAAAVEAGAELRVAGEAEDRGAISPYDVTRA